MPMDYRDVMTVLSQSGLGAALLGERSEERRVGKECM